VEWINISSGTSWEPVVGYCRAVRVGAHVYVAGTPRLEPTAKSPARAMPTRRRFRPSKTLNARWSGPELHGKMSSATRVFLTNIADWEKAGKAHGEFFRDIRPASTMVAIRALISPEMLLEIEAEAIVPDGE